MWKDEEFDNFVQTYEEEKAKEESNPAEEKPALDTIENLELTEVPEKAVDTQSNPEAVVAGAPLHIDLEEVATNNKPLENSQVLLAIYEVANNSNFYGLNQSNKSRAFWDKLSNVSCFEKILAVFKSETLRKYWRLLSEINNQKKVIDTIKKNSNEIDATALKVLTIITLLKDFIAGRVSNLAKTLAETPDKSIPRNTYTEKRRTNPKEDDESYEVEDNRAKKAFLSTKRKNEEMTDIDKNIKDLNNLIDPENELKKASGKRSTRNRGQANLFSDEDKRVFSEIEVIVNTFKSVIPEASEGEIWDALKRNSFNIINTYLYLNEPEVYDDVCFNDEDDYILKNLSKSFFYKKLVSEKGKDRVQEREIFLDIDHN
mmetsp:Transcript_7626/g.7851  ORF Transcript_7626/g.7851 Transcript_7626/m.7851 type:complete len:373 (-) Transcript_7626:26-1144(-)